MIKDEKNIEMIGIILATASIISILMYGIIVFDAFSLGNISPYLFFWR